MLLSATSAVARAAPTVIEFTARIGADNGNVLDTDDVFGQGRGTSLTGQMIVGSVTIDPDSLSDRCSTGGGCYGDFGAGAVSVSFALNGVTSTVVSVGTLGYFGNTSGGSVQIEDKTDGLANYLAAGATTADGSMQQSIGALFDNATLFSAYGDGDPAVAVASLGRIGGGSGLVKGGITLLTPDEHIDATILTIEVPEPGGLALLGMALAGLAAVRRKRHF